MRQQLISDWLQIGVQSLPSSPLWLCLIFKNYHLLLRGPWVPAGTSRPFHSWSWVKTVVVEISGEAVPPHGAPPAGAQWSHVPPHVSNSSDGCRPTSSVGAELLTQLNGRRPWWSLASIRLQYLEYPWQDTELGWIQHCWMWVETTP